MTPPPTPDLIDRTVLRANVQASTTELPAKPWLPGDRRLTRRELLDLIDAAPPAATEPSQESELRAAVEAALEEATAAGDRHRERAQRTAISGEDWRFTNGFDAALKCLDPVRALLAGDKAEAPRPRARSLVCSIAKHEKCDGHAPNGDLTTPCDCTCHGARTEP